jgi:hypothetical protein
MAFGIGALIGGGLDFVGNIIGGIQGNKLGNRQMEMGQQMINEGQDMSAQYQRPEFQTPEAINRMMSMSQSRQYQDMPGLSQMQNQLGQSTAQGMTAIGDMGAGAESMGALANLYSNQMGQGQQLAIQNSMFKDQAEQQYMNNLEGLGDWQQQAWQYNKADPYMQAQQKASQLEMMGRQGMWEGEKNKMGSWGQTAQGAGSALGGMFEQLGASGMFGGGGGQAPVAGGGGQAPAVAPQGPPAAYTNNYITGAGGNPNQYQ